MTAHPQRKATLRPVEESESYVRSDVRERVRLLTVRESGYVPRLPRDGDDDRPRVVDSGAYLRERRRR